MRDGFDMQKKWNQTINGDFGNLIGWNPTPQINTTRTRTVNGPVKTAEYSGHL
jgi:hypothetical protein